MISALFVAEDGPYANRPNVDPWPEVRDARTYLGPWPVVAHPPCERWGRYATGGPNPKAVRRQVGDDAGCFAAALAAVRRFGGVLEHPSGSHAFRHFELPIPAKDGWTHADAHGGRSCRVDQGRYGHAAKKATWLYAVLPAYPDLDWRPASGMMRLELGPRSKEHAKALRSSPDYRPLKRLSKRQRIHTPEPFATLLLGMAMTRLLSEAQGVPK